VLLTNYIRDAVKRVLIVAIE